MSELTIYHNPRCSKSRQTLALIEEHGVEATVIEYLKSPLDVATLKSLATRLGVSPREMMRTKEAAYRENKLAEADDEALLQAIVAHPILLERPIVVRGNKAIMGRPPENVLELIN
ncbi:MAG: arsenate reductase (glutaredoxin) [Pseudomonadales bacterium]